MYLARKMVNGETRFSLRETFRKGKKLSFRSLFDLGNSPEEYIVYPGGNAFYVDENLVSRLEDAGVRVDHEELEDLFWPFVRGDIRYAIESFRGRSQKQSKRKKLTSIENEKIQKTVHSFDKRRAHFLKFGNMDEGPVSRMPPVIFKNLVGKSRDEIEQNFIEKELELNETELKTYVYTAFDLQRFFSSILIAKKMPQGLDQKKVDAFFLEEICRINQDLFSSNEKQKPDNLHEYMKRYMIMFFDHEYEHTRLLDEYARDFIFRHRFFPTHPPKEKIKRSEAAELFNLSQEELSQIDAAELRKRYRRLARKHHPDHGGSAEKFIDLCRAYECLCDTV